VQPIAHTTHPEPGQNISPKRAGRLQVGHSSGASTSPPTRSCKARIFSLLDTQMTRLAARTCADPDQPDRTRHAQRQPPRRLPPGRRTHRTQPVSAEFRRRRLVPSSPTTITAVRVHVPRPVDGRRCGGRGPTTSTHQGHDVMEEHGRRSNRTTSSPPLQFELGKCDGRPSSRRCCNASRSFDSDLARRSASGSDQRRHDDDAHDNIAPSPSLAMVTETNTRSTPGRANPRR